MTGLDPHDGWRPVSRTRTYELVIDQVEEQIQSGALTVGDRLPPERDLAGMLNVSRAAVREALRVLEAHGVLTMSVGTGADSGTTVAALPSRALARMLRLHVALANFPTGDVVEARVMLERESAWWAANRASAEDLAQLWALLERMDAPELSRDQFNELDTAFHVAIAEAGGNRLIADMTIAIRESLRIPMRIAFRQLGDGWADIAVELRREHLRLVEALASGDGDRARECMEEHIRGFYRKVPDAARLS